ncbi:MAG: hypothetical protein CL780_02250 [Chloroflexi bacterium]|nr:hypothetical protein [Chloroflexota bacterium]
MGYYETLGVPKNASNSEIKKKYRELARELHPDLNQGDKSASDHFKKINDAYDVLSDKKKRKDYDDFGDNWKHAKQMRDSGYGHQQFGGINDLFGSNFSNQSSFRNIFGGSRTKKSKPQNVSINISLEEAFSGTERRFNLKNNQSDNKIIDVKIPMGITEGKTIRLRTSSGIIDAKIHINKHLNFSVQGINIFSKFNISLFDAIFGCDVEISTIDGNVSLFIPPGTPNGKKFRLRGKGMPVMNGDSRGDMFSTIEVMLPRDFSEKELRVLKKMKEKREEKGKINQDAQ